MKLKLSDICTYRNSKVDVKDLNAETYVSTENMLPDKGGITEAASLPTVPLTQGYKKDDVLVSNIRPYFKKIWRAKNDGGCSNDVLVFQANENIDKEFLYYVLANDDFFAYSMATSKGTKMPRGDRFSIMQYEVPNFDLETQRKIAAILSALDDKIELNNKINENLEQQAQAIFKSWFVDFEPFGGKMPAEWKVGKLSEIAEISSGKRPAMKQSTKTNDVCIPLVGAASVMGYTNKSNYNDKILVTGRVGTHGVIQRFNSPCWASDNTLVIESGCYEYVYQILQCIDYKNLNRGSTQPLITQSDLKKTSIILPTNNILQKFENIVCSLMAVNEQNQQENQRLSALRDTLLPKLMNGEIEV